ncbi:MAG TPA: DNA polymerase III subunit beta [Bacteroidales bacterium]|nr:DNA polymerase III subunit beta [Bacteroidales bacterium]HQH18243.1 DNA polymerase III subunit beta [Bacteroidales bacterium]HQI45232.1 DNA polymerase III subunit beta [Bacteroidales bacterium]
MKFIVSSTALLKQLQAISGVINSNNTLPILDDFLFELDKENLNISASDLETTMTAKVAVTMSEKTGSIAIPAKILLDIMKTFADIPVTFTIDTKTTFAIEISAGEGKYKLTGHNAVDFPRTPSLENASALEIDAEVLAGAINKTLFATGTDELRPVMSGVFCQLSEDQLIFVATDAHKLVRYIRKDAKSEEASNFILPKKPLNQLKNILGQQDGKVKIEYNNTNAFFEFGNYNLICRLIDGKYPNYEAVIPTDSPFKLVIERIPFLNAIKRVSIFSNQSTHQVRFKISGQELALSAEDLDFSNEAKERLSCQYEGEDIEIGFNSKFILEMLNIIDTDEVCLEIIAPNRAGLLLPVNNDNKNEDILMLVMPVMLNS